MHRRTIRILLIGKHHLVDGVGGSGGILQVVRSVVPTPANIYVFAGFGGMIYDITVVSMATVFQERVVAATLLPHVVQQIIGSAIVDVHIDGETGRDGFTRFQVINARLREIAEVQPTGVFFTSHPTCGLGCIESIHHLFGKGVNQRKKFSMFVSSSLMNTATFTDCGR